MTSRQSPMTFRNGSGWSLVIGYGSIRVALINLAVQSFLRQLIPCTTGIKEPGCVMLIFRMLQKVDGAIELDLRPIWKVFNGSHEVGLYKNFLRPKNWVFWIRTGKIWVQDQTIKPLLPPLLALRKHLLENSMSLRNKQTSVVERFSWTANRVTSRREDRAYCLLGLFTINIPLLYGEGDKAFHRLQQEIIRSSNDESIFVWETISGLYETKLPGAILADTPAEFRSARFGVHGYNQLKYSKIPGLRRAPFAITNQGLEFRVPKIFTNRSHFLLPLNCLYRGDDFGGAYAILLIREGFEGVWLRDFGRNTGSDH